MTSPESTCGPTDVPPDVDIDAMREKYAQSANKRLRKEGSKQYLETRRRFAESLRGGSAHTRRRARPDRRGHRRRGARRRLRRPAVRRLSEEGRRRGRPHHRAWAATSVASGTGTAIPESSATTNPTATYRCSKSSTSFRARSSPTVPRSTQHCRNIGKHFGLYDGAIFSTQVRDLRWDEDDRALADQHQPRRRHPGPLRGDGVGLVQPAEAARHPRHQGLPDAGTCLPLRRAGTTTTPAATPTGGLDKLADKRVALVGTGATGVQLVPHPGPGCQAPLRLPAHPVVGRRARQHADRSRVGVRRCSRAGRRSGKRNFHLVAVRRCGARRSRIWSATSGPNSGAMPTARIAACEDPASLTARAVHGAPRGRRLQDHGAAAPPRRRPRRRSRRPPRRSSRTTGSCASGRAPTTTTCRPSTGPT